MASKEGLFESKSEDTTGPLLLVSHKESLLGMFEELFREGKEGVESNQVVISLRHKDLTNSSGVMCDHLGLNGMFSKIKKATVSVIKEGQSVSVGIEREDRRVVFIYDLDTMECSSSMQRRIRRNKDRDSWEDLDVLETTLEDLYSITSSVESVLIKRSDSL